jgi:hypothetical protein
MSVSMAHCRENSWEFFPKKRATRLPGERYGVLSASKDRLERQA